MGTPVIQSSFNSGEFAPALYARTDLAKYHSAAALLRNFFVDYRGGASTRPGTEYILQCYKSSTAVRLIPFQASFQVSYVLEFGDRYIRFFNNKTPILENAIAITAATRANPLVVQVPGNAYAAGDWIYLAGVAGMTQVNGQYFSITSVVGEFLTLATVNGVPVDSTGYSAYTSGGTAARIYTITSPYAAADIGTIKFVQNVNTLILCHPAYPAQVLTLLTANNWTLLPITFGTTVSSPATVSVTTSLASGQVSYGYIVTSIDSSGQESPALTTGNINNIQNMASVGGANYIRWPAQAGAVSYNVYKSDITYNSTILAGVPYGFIGNVTGTGIDDVNILPDFTSSPPIAQNPFVGTGVESVTVTNPGVATSVPQVTFSAVGSTVVAYATAILQVQGTPTVGSGGTGYVVGDRLAFTNGVTLVVAAVTAGVITAFSPITAALSSPGAVSFGAVPTNPVAQVSTTGTGTGATANLVWGVGIVQVINQGAGYVSVPGVSFSTGSATATAVLASASNGYPAVPGFFQQRLVLCAQDGAPQTLNFSQPGNYYNFNVSSPIIASDAIGVTLASGQLNVIKSLVSTSAGLIVFTDRASWLINGGTGAGSAISPSSIVANIQSYNGASDVPPIVSNYDIIYVQSKGSIVRDSTYNFYANVFTGTDISVASSHLFYGHTIVEWAWAEEPFKVVWAVRDDGVLLSLTFVKEQEFIGWAHSDTNGGLFKSIATVTELTSSGEVDAIYTVVQRTVGGNQVKYIERMYERNWVIASDSWCVDSGLRYSGAPVTEFSNADHLAGLTVTGLADGVVIPPFVMPMNGVFNLPAAASIVTIGIPMTAQLQTLAIDTGEPTIQSKDKKINAVTLKVQEALGLQMGSSFDRMVNMKDLVVGNVGSMTNKVVADLVSGDVRTFLDPTYTVLGQYCIQQSLPLPATILGVIPEITTGGGK